MECNTNRIIDEYAVNIGRPRKKDEDKRSCRFTVRVNPTDKDALIALVKTRNKTLSDFMRDSALYCMKTRPKKLFEFQSETSKRIKNTSVRRGAPFKNEEEKLSIPLPLVMTEVEKRLFSRFAKSNGWKLTKYLRESTRFCLRNEIF